IITGVIAVWVLWLLKDGGARNTAGIAAWNLFGAADLVLANRVRHHVDGGLALAAFPRTGLGGDAARALVVRSDGASHDLANPARNYCRAASAHQTGPTR